MRLAPTDQAREDAIGFPFASPFDARDEDLPAAQEYVRAMESNLNTTLKELQELSPPPGLSGEHDGYVSALSRLVELWLQLRGRTEAVPSADEFNDALLRFFDSPAWVDASAEADKACETLQAKAQELGADQLLEC